METASYSNQIVEKAFTWAYKELGVSASEAAKLLGSSEVYGNSSGFLKPQNQEEHYRKQLSFIRMYHLLIVLSEGDTNTMKSLYQRHHRAIGTSPKHLCFSLNGIEKVTDYLRELNDTSNLLSCYSLATNDKENTAPSRLLH